MDGVSLHKEARKPRGALAVIGTQAMGRGRKRTNDVIASCDVLDGRRLELIKTPTADCFVFPYVGSKRGTAIRVPNNVDVRIERVMARASLSSTSDLSSDFVHHLLTLGACSIATRGRCAPQSLIT